MGVMAKPGDALLDAGVRVGVHRSGRVSSLRVTEVDVTPVGVKGPLLVDREAARQALLDYEAARNPRATVVVDQERQALVLPEQAASARVEPAVVFNYSLRFTYGDGTTSVSRQKMLAVGVSTGTVRQVFPVPAGGDGT